VKDKSALETMKNGQAYTNIIMDRDFITGTTQNKIDEG
jgi:hypothetical protein